MYLIPYHYKHYCNEQTYTEIFVNIADTCIRFLEIINKPLGEEKKTSWYFLIHIVDYFPVTSTLNQHQEHDGTYNATLLLLNIII